MTALVIQTAFLGDVVLTTPLLAALAERHGPVSVVTTPAAAPLLETLPTVRSVVAYDKRGGDRGWRGLMDLAGKLARQDYEVAYIPHRSLRSAALALSARIPRRVGFRGAWSFLYTERRAKPETGHESDRLLALADEGPGAYPPQIRPTSDDERAVDAFLAGSALRDGHAGLIVLAPGSIWGSKRWPFYDLLAAQLSDRHAIAVIGGAADAELGDCVVAASAKGRAANACGKLTLRQSAALIGRARLLITNDSAPLHLGTAMDTPVVALFGPTVPDFGFGPIRPGDVALGIEGLSCRPCSPHGPPSCPLEHHRCMRELRVDAVLNAIEERLTSALRRRD